MQTSMQTPDDGAFPRDGGFVRPSPLPALDELAAQVNQPMYAARVRATLTPANYGRLWSVGELLRMDQNRALPIIDALNGVDRKTGQSNPAQRARILVALEVVHDYPLVHESNAPHPDDPPGLSVGHAQMDGGPGHHAPSQWRWRKVFERRARERFTVQLVGDVIWEAGIALMKRYGWGTTRGGRTDLRYIVTNKKSYPQAPDNHILIDTWRLFEVADVALHPDLMPPEHARGMRPEMPIAEALAAEKAAQEAEHAASRLAHETAKRLAAGQAKGNGDADDAEAAHLRAEIAKERAKGKKE